MILLKKKGPLFRDPFFCGKLYIGEFYAQGARKPSSIGMKITANT